MRREVASAEVRSTLLDEGATAAGASWARGWINDLRAEHRRVSGGWPGTLTEARARGVAQLEPELRRRRMLALTYDERERVARITYAKAKQDWLRCGEPDPPEPDG